MDVEQNLTGWFCSTTLMDEKMVRTISKEEYLEAGQFFRWATNEHYLLWFYGSLKRQRRNEVMLPRLVKKGKLVSRKFGKKLIYAVPRLKNIPASQIPHELGCTDTLVRICRSEQDGEIITERFFRRLWIVPDWGVKYGEKLLLCEFSTKNNFETGRIIKTKITKYDHNFEKIIKKFNASRLRVLFVLDIPRERVLNFVLRNKTSGLFFFIDYETFKSVSFGKQLTTKVYFWKDGKTYSLIPC